jgi:hypothetical protein
MRVVVGVALSSTRWLIPAGEPNLFDTGAAALSAKQRNCVPRKRLAGIYICDALCNTTPDSLCCGSFT